MQSSAPAVLPVGPSAIGTKPPKKNVTSLWKAHLHFCCERCRRCRCCRCCSRRRMGRFELSPKDLGVQRRSVASSLCSNIQAPVLQQRSAKPSSPGCCAYQHHEASAQQPAMKRSKELAGTGRGKTATTQPELLQSSQSRRWQSHCNPHRKSQAPLAVCRSATRACGLWPGVLEGC